MSDNSRVRVSIVGIVVVALFSTLLARLWFLQSGPADNLKVQAVADSTRVIQTESPRGEILDRNGRVLVKDRASWAVTVDRDLSETTATRVLGRLSEQLAIPPEDLESQYTSIRQSPLEPAIVALDVDQPKRLSIMQDPQDYPGVHVMQLTVRSYPQGDLAAQTLGYVGEVPKEDLERLENDPGQYEPGDEIGRAGAEAAFETVLRGKPHREEIQVDPRGQQVGDAVETQHGAVGGNVYLTLDSGVQRAAEESLQQGIEGARHLQDVNIEDHYEPLKAPAGSAVVLDANNGSVVAMASYPTYSPKWWVGGISAPNYARLTNSASNNPLLNRATQGVYAPGSTFKMVTALAMVPNGIQDPNQFVDDTGSVRIQGTTFTNANKGEVLGPVNLESALSKSSDVYFYNVGYNFWRTWKGGDATRGLGIQSEARKLGFGEKSGFDLDEADGRVPDPDWKSAFAHANYDTARAKRENSIWYPYDNLSLAVGQGDLVATPLQLANAYAAFANGGTLWRPHIAGKVPVKGKVTPVKRKAIRRIAFDPNLHAQMMAGFTGAIADPKGTAYDAFRGFPLDAHPIAGKTGTAQVKGKGDTSIFVGMFSADGKQYVVAVVMEESGFGAQTAAPVARRIIETMNGLPAPPVQVIQQGHD